MENCDLSSLNSVRQFAAKMLETESRVDILINCAGVKETPQWLTQVEQSVLVPIKYAAYDYYNIRMGLSIS